MGLPSFVRGKLTSRQRPQEFCCRQSSVCAECDKSFTERERNRTQDQGAEGPTLLHFYCPEMAEAYFDGTQDEAYPLR